ncbi:MAG: preprotein translocase subunit SecE [Lachnospiraceae bacterium]
MGENEKVVKVQKAQKEKKPGFADKIKSVCKGLKIEFNKIIWPSKEELGKKTLVVIVCSTVLTVIIAVIDMLSKYGVDFLINLVK